MTDRQRPILVAVALLARGHEQVALHPSHDFEHVLVERPATRIQRGRRGHTLDFANHLAPCRGVVILTTGNARNEQNREQAAADDPR
jgi:hypothetical protein